MAATELLDQPAARNRELQRQVLGNTVREIITRARGELGLTQQEIADAVGLSQPMISQLASGRRGLPTSPAVHQKLRGLVKMAPDGRGATASVSPQELAAIRRRAGSALAPLPHHSESAGTEDAAIVHRVLTDLAAPPELAASGKALRRTAPKLAELLTDLATLSRSDFLTKHGEQS